MTDVRGVRCNACGKTTEEPATYVRVHVTRLQLGAISVEYDACSPECASEEAFDAVPRALAPPVAPPAEVTVPVDPIDAVAAGLAEIVDGELHAVAPEIAASLEGEERAQFLASAPEMALPE